MLSKHRGGHHRGLSPLQPHVWRDVCHAGAGGRGDFPEAAEGEEGVGGKGYRAV